MKRNNEAGFTLISVIMAVVILSIGLLALTKSQSLLIRAEAMSAQRSVALGIARNYVEEVRSRIPDPTAEPAVSVDETGTLAAAGKYRRSLEVADLGNNLYQVTCNVIYPRNTTPVSIVTLIYR
jgi:Tfp pilus assembly protein PilV